MVGNLETRTLHNDVWTDWLGGILTLRMFPRMTLGRKEGNGDERLSAWRGVGGAQVQTFSPDRK